MFTLDERPGAAQFYAKKRALGPSRVATARGIKKKIREMEARKADKYYNQG